MGGSRGELGLMHADFGRDFGAVAAAALETGCLDALECAGGVLERALTAGAAERRRRWRAGGCTGPPRHGVAA